MDTPLYTIARAFVAQHDLGNTQLEFLAQTHNVVYRVRTPHATFVLRIQPHNALERLQREVKILTLLQSSHLPISHIIPTRDGRFIMESAHHVAVLLTFLEGGTQTPQSLTLDHLQRCGKFLGHFHELNIHLDDPYFLNADGLLGGENSYNDGLYKLYVQAWLNAKQYKIVLTCRQLVEPILVHSENCGLIHGDFLLHNILFDGKLVKALDWEYSANGVYLYDLAPLLWQLKPQANYAELFHAYTEAYYGIRPAMRAQHGTLETLILARHLASIRWVAHNADNPMIAPNAFRIIAHRVTELEAFLDTGILQRTNFVA